jgi:citronellol/citronellal dehydrogenase
MERGADARVVQEVRAATFRPSWQDSHPQSSARERQAAVPTQTLAGRTILMSGGSRGIGLAIAVRAARDGANVAFIAKTDAPDPRLAGTIHTAAADIEAAGGTALPILGDIRDDQTVAAAVAQTVDRFGGIDIVVNNASAITLQDIGELSPKRYDLMLDINARGTFALTSLALRHLLRSDNAHVLTLSPPLNMDRRWLQHHAPYTVSKYAMTMLTLGVAESRREAGIAANCLWPRTLIATAAVQNLLGGDDSMAGARTPEIVADAAHEILTRPSRECTGNTFIDDEVLREAGVTDLGKYRFGGGSEDDLALDIFL